MIQAHEQYTALKNEHEAAMVAAAEAHRIRKEAIANAKRLGPLVKRAGVARVAVERDGKTVFVGAVAKAIELPGEIVEATEKHRIALSVGKARSDYEREFGFCLRDIGLGINIDANQERCSIFRAAGIEPAAVPMQAPAKKDSVITSDVMRRAHLILAGKLPRLDNGDAAILADAILAARVEAESPTQAGG